MVPIPRTRRRVPPAVRPCRPGESSRHVEPERAAPAAPIRSGPTGSTSPPVCRTVRRLPEGTLPVPPRGAAPATSARSSTPGRGGKRLHRCLRRHGRTRRQTGTRRRVASCGRGERTRGRPAADRRASRAFPSLPARPWCAAPASRIRRGRGSGRGPNSLPPAARCRPIRGEPPPSARRPGEGRRPCARSGTKRVRAGRRSPRPVPTPGQRRRSRSTRRPEQEPPRRPRLDRETRAGWPAREPNRASGLPGQASEARDEERTLV